MSDDLFLINYTTTTKPTTPLFVDGALARIDVARGQADRVVLRRVVSRRVVSCRVAVVTFTKFEI